VNNIIITENGVHWSLAKKCKMNLQKMLCLMFMHVRHEKEREKEKKAKIGCNEEV
jgi:hypothetical protein